MSRLARYAAGLGIIGGAVLLRWALVPVAGSQTPYLVVFPAMLLVAIPFGAGPGLVAGVLGLWVTETWILVPTDYVQVPVAWVPVALRIFLTLTCTLVVGLMGQRLRSARRKEAALLGAAQQERDRLSTVMDSISDEVWFAGPEGRFTRVNPSARREFGITPPADIDVRELIDSLQILRPDGSPRPSDEAPVLRALDGETIRNMEEVVRTPATGELRHRLVSAAPVLDGQGQVIGAVCVARDVTDEHLAELAMLRHQKLESLGVLAGGIAHDFNNLLTAILGNVALARMESDPGGVVHERLGDAEQAMSRAKDLTQQLLTFSRGGTPIRRPFGRSDAPVDVHLTSCCCGPRASPRLHPSSETGS